MRACNGSAWSFWPLGYPRTQSPVHHEKISTETSAVNCSMHVTRVCTCLVQNRQSSILWQSELFVCLQDVPGLNLCSVAKARLCNNQRSPKKISKRHLFLFYFITVWPTAIGGKCPVDLILGYSLVILQVPVSHTRLLHQPGGRRQIFFSPQLFKVIPAVVFSSLCRGKTLSGIITDLWAVWPPRAQKI